MASHRGASVSSGSTRFSPVGRGPSRPEFDGSVGRLSIRVAVALVVGSLISFGPGSAGSGAAQIFTPVDADGPIGIFIASGDPSSGYRTGDSELARWAFEAWGEASEGALRFRTVPEDSAIIRVYWEVPTERTYGSTMPILAGSRLAAAVHVSPDTRSLRPEIHERATSDSVFRDAVIYLTCLHEIGHALALGHTAEPGDAMYAFRQGGDIVDYFQRYRGRLRSRPDIRRESGLSTGDVRALELLY